MPIYKTDKKKDGKQQYRVMVSYTTPQGEYKKKTKLVYGMPEAKFAEMKIMSELGEQTPTSSMTVESLFKEYITNKKSEVRETSLNKTINIFKTRILPYLKDIKLQNLDIRQLQKWKNTINEQDFSITTKKNTYGELRTMLNYAVKMGYLTQNPLPRVGNFKEVYFTKPQDTIHYYTAEQFKKFIEVAKKHTDTRIDQGIYVFFCIAFYTGMRKGEINALKWSDIEGNIIHVRRSIAQKIKGKPFVETPPKNRSSYRDLQMPSVLIEILNTHKSKQMQNEAFTEDFRVCGGNNILSDSYIDLRNRKYADEAELPRIRIHDFRHSHASLLANESINIQEIARRLGHSKIETTWNTYSHLYPREEERAVRILDNLFN